MRKLLPLVFIILVVSCTRKDIIWFVGNQSKQQCKVTAINADKTGTDDFYLIKTFDGKGVLTHIKAQVGDYYGAKYVFDYAITYARNKAIFKGSTKAYHWVLDVQPENPDDPVDPDAHTHPEEDTTVRDLRSFEILLDDKTKYPVEVRVANTGESLLKLKYDSRGYLSQVGDFYAKTDERGNLLELLTAPLVEEEPYYGPQQLGYWYNYSDRPATKGVTQFYEAPTIFISPYYTLLELLNWGPFQPDRERVYVLLQHRYAEEYLPSPTMEMQYFNHQYDASGRLMKYDFEGEDQRQLPYMGPFMRKSDRIITWQCAGNKPQP